MAIRPVKELPRRKGGFCDKDSYVAKDVREFLRLGYDLAAVEYPGKKAKSVQEALRHYFERHPRECAGMSAVRRGDVVYITREVTR